MFHHLVARPTFNNESNTGKFKRTNSASEMRRAVPKISFTRSSPPPIPRHSEGKNWNDDSTDKDMNTQTNETLKKKFRYPLIIEKLNDEAKRIFRFRNNNKTSNRDTQSDAISKPKKSMDTLKVPTTNITRKRSNSAIKPKAQENLNKNSKPYYIIKDVAANNLLYYNQQNTAPRTTFTFKETKPPFPVIATKSNDNARVYLRDQFEKVQHVELSNSTMTRSKILRDTNKSNPLLHARVGWMSPGPVTGSRHGRSLTITERQDKRKLFSYNFTSKNQ